MRIRGRGRRGGAIFSIVTALIFHGFWLFLAVGAYLFFSQPENASYFTAALSSGLMFAMLYWQLAPVLSASFGASLDLRKLLAYPIPRDKLFLIEILLRITTCAEMLILVGGAAAGLLRNPAYGARASLGITAGFLLFSAINVLLAAGVRNWLERLFLRTKLKEVIVFLLVLAGLAPRLFLYLHVPKSAILRFAPVQLAWPWAAPARLMLSDHTGLALLVSLVWLAAATAFSRRQFERTLRFDSAGTVRRPDRPNRPDGFIERIFRLPSRFFPDPMAALIEKELRTYSRIPRFRLVYAMSCFFGVAMSLPLIQHPERHVFFMQHALPLMSLYGLLMLGQISYWNSFGFDRSAVQGYFSWPIRFRDVIVAKNLTVLFLLCPQVLTLAAIARLIHVPAGPGRIAEMFTVIVVASIYWFSLGNIFSVRMPRALDPDKMNQMSNKLQALSIWTAPFLLLPIVLAYWAGWFFENEWVFAGLMLVAAGVGAAFYWVALDSAVRTAVLRREAILTELSRSEGPLSNT